jgi:asparagine synthase (glutamine-hydrolysing)
MIYDYVGSSTAYNKTLVNPLFTQSLLNKKSTVPAEKRAKILWMLFCVEVWHKKVYQG